MKSFSHQGRVIQSAILAGSFRKVTVASGVEKLRSYVVGLGPGNRHPRLGDVIIVTGIEKDGKFLTSNWDFV